MDAEKVIVELIANVDQFDRSTVRTATKFEGSMNRIEAAAVKGEGAVRKSSTAMLQASTAMYRGFDDVGRFLNSSPNSPFVVPVKQAPAVGNAMKYIHTGAAALGGVMGGLLASGVLAGAAALAEFIIKGKGTKAQIDELVEGLKDKARQTDLARQADEQFGRTIEGLNAALDEQEIALNKIAEADKGVAYQAAIAAEKKRLEAIEIRKNTVAALENAQTQLEVLRIQQAQNGGSLRESGVNAEIAITEQRLQSLRSKLADAQAGLQRAEQQADKALSLAAVERGSESEVDGIKRKYDALVESTRKRLVAEGKVASEIVKQTKALREQQRVEEDAARKRKQNQGDPKLPKVTSSEVQALVKDFFGSGTAITSTARSAGANKRAGGAANSFHLTGQAIDFVPQGGARAFDKEMLRLAAEARGIKLVEILGPGDKGHSDHGHVAFARARLGPDQVAKAQEQRAQAEQRLALEAERREQAFGNEQANLDQQVIDARQALVLAAQEIARLELEAIEKARVQYNEKLASLVEQNKISKGVKGLTAAEAEELQKLNDERAKLRTELVKRREDERKFRIAEADAQRKLDFQIGGKQVEADLLQSRAGLATTAKQRHDLEKRLIDIQFEEERLQLQGVIAASERLKIETERIETLRALSDEEKAALRRAQDQAALAQQRLDNQGERQANAQSGNDQSNASPLQDFFQQIPDTAGEINEALEGIAAGGLASVTDGLTDAILGFRSFGDVARAAVAQVVASLIKLGIQQLLLHTIGQTAAAAATDANAALGATTAAAWAPAAAAVSLATFGANSGPAIAGMTAANAVASLLATPKGFMSGGFTGNGSRFDPAGIVHGQEYVFDAAATRRIGVGNLEALRSGSIRPSNAAAVAPRGSGGGGLSPDALAKLGGIVRDAITAMPPVNLYPTFDPVAAFEAAMNTKRGRQVMAEFMGNNRSTMGGALQ